MAPQVTRGADDQLGFDATLLYGISYPADTWVPLRLHFRNSSDRDYEGSAAIPVEGAIGSPTFRLPIVVPARSRVTATAYAYFPALPEVPRKKDAEGSSSAPVLTIAQWESGGARIGRTEIRARGEAPEQIRSIVGSASAHPESLLLSINESAEDSTAYNMMDFSQGLSGITGSWIASAHLETPAIPNVFAGYVACRALVLNQTDPDILDMSQRQALLNYLSSGGTLIIPCPPEGADPTYSWLAPYLPVQIVGQRQMNQIIPAATSDKKATKPFTLAGWLPIVEAIEEDGAVVLLRDRDYVHAAYKAIGAGRVVFTSFPINALDMKDPRVQDLWTQLVNLNGRRADWSDSALVDTKQSYLQSMIGLRTPPWSLAAGIAAGYLVLVALVQFAFPGAKRPRGFAVATVVAVVLSGVLIAMTALRQQGTDLTGAQLAVLNLSPTGGGLQQSVQAFYGNDQSLTLTAASPDVTVQPLTSGVTHPTIELQPFRVPDAAVHAEKVEQVWMVEGTLPIGIGARAVGRFGPEGLAISVDNRLNGVIEAPLLVWDAQQFSLANLPPGDSTVLAGRENRNLPGQYTNVALAISENATMRGSILKDLVMPPEQTTTAAQFQGERFVAGWLDASAAPSLIEYAPQAPQLRSQTLARLPLQIEPTPVGTAVKIDGAFMHFPRAATMGLPFDYAKNEWLDSTEGSWLLCIAAPREVGQLRTKRALVEVDIEAPQHTIELRRGQVSGGKPRQNLAGPSIASWTNPLGKQTVSFEVEPADADANGYVWLLMEAKFTPLAQTGQVVGRWKFRSFAVSYESEVIGGPEKVSLSEPNGFGRDDDDE